MFRIVLVEDNKVNQLLMKKRLTKLYSETNSNSPELEILIKSTFDEAKKYFETTNDYDLVILDGNLVPSSRDRRKSLTLFDTDQKIEFTTNPEPKTENSSSENSGVDLAKLLIKKGTKATIIPWTDDEEKLAGFHDVLGKTPVLAKPLTPNNLRETLIHYMSSPYTKRRHTISTSPSMTF